LRVFPFQAGETRYTGLEFIHATPISLTLGDQQIQLGSSDTPAPYERIFPAAAFISAQAKQKLPRLSRHPAYHFIIDFSSDAKEKTPLYLKRVADFIKTRQLHPDDVTISAANYALKTTALTDVWMQTLSHFPVEGGFNLDRAIKTFLYEHYSTASPKYPVLITVTDNSCHGQTYEDYRTWQQTFPDSPFYYRLAADQKLYSLSLLAEKPTETVVPGHLPDTLPVLAWPNKSNHRVYLPDDGKDSIVLTAQAFRSRPPVINQTGWENSLILEALGLGLVMNPVNYHQRELAMVKASLHSGIMSRFTAFLVLENAAQEAALREKQKQILASQKIVDTGNSKEMPLSNSEMAEPPFVLIALLAVVICVGTKLAQSHIKGYDA
jgi:hypothetical protein